LKLLYEQNLLSKIQNTKLQHIGTDSEAGGASGPLAALLRAMPEHGESSFFSILLNLIES